MLFILSFHVYGTLWGGVFAGPDKPPEYSSEAWMDLEVYLFEIKQTTFYVKYISFLEMKDQGPPIYFDPFWSTYHIITGLERKWHGGLKFYFDHFCRHVIDQPDTLFGKAVFNGFFLEWSSATSPVEKYSKKKSFSITYAFFPQTDIISYLNSTPFFRHVLEGEITFSHSPLLFKLRAGYIRSMEIEKRGRYYPPGHHWYFYPEIEIFKVENGKCLSFFLRYYLIMHRDKSLIIEHPAIKPQGLFFPGLKFTFSF